MKDILIATCGTSILTNNKEIYKDILGDRYLNSISEDEAKIIKGKILDYLKDKKVFDRKCGAELNSTYYILEKKYFSNQKIYLVVSDSEEGKLSGEIIEKLLKEKLKTLKVEIVKIENLNITKEFDFAKKGLRNLVSKVTSILSTEHHNSILAPIGGLKAQIFIVGLLGQLFKVPAYYLYENSTNIIELLPLPISLDLNFFFRNLEIISKINENGMIDKKEIKNYSSYLKQEPELRNIIEEEKIDGNTYLALSPLGLVTYEKLNQENYCALPREATLEEKSTEIQYKNKEGHLKKLLLQSDSMKIVETILEIPYVKKVLFNYYNPDSKGDTIRITNSSHDDEGSVLKIIISRKQGMAEALIFLTENSEENLNAAKLDIFKNISKF